MKGANFEEGPSHLRPNPQGRCWFTGLQGGPASEKQTEARAAAELPHQAVLHLQHANHPSVSPCLQPLLHQVLMHSASSCSSHPSGYIFCPASHRTTWICHLDSTSALVIRLSDSDLGVIFFVGGDPTASLQVH